MADNKESDASEIASVIVELQRRAHTEIYTRMGLRHQISRVQLLLLGGILAAIALLLDRRSDEVGKIIDGGLADIGQVVVVLVVICGLIVLSSVFSILATSYYAHTMHMYTAAYFERKILFDILTRLVDGQTNLVSREDLTAMFSWEAVVKRMRTRTGLNDYHAEERFGFSVPFLLLTCVAILVGLLVVSFAVGKLNRMITIETLYTFEISNALAFALALIVLWSGYRCGWFYRQAWRARIAVTRLREQDLLTKSELERANIAIDKITRAEASSQSTLAWLFSWIWKNPAEVQPR